MACSQKGDSKGLANKEFKYICGVNVLSEITGKEKYSNRVRISFNLYSWSPAPTKNSLNINYNPCTVSMLLLFIAAFTDTMYG